MVLINALPKDKEGNIVMSPVGKINNKYVDGTVSVDWFKVTFSDLANEDVPLSAEGYERLKSIDDYWKQNAEKWRATGII